jgi:hypothetical protein
MAWGSVDLLLIRAMVEALMFGGTVLGLTFAITSMPSVARPGERVAELFCYRLGLGLVFKHCITLATLVIQIMCPLMYSTVRAALPGIAAFHGVDFSCNIVMLMLMLFDSGECMKPGLEVYHIGLLSLCVARSGGLMAYAIFLGLSDRARIEPEVRVVRMGQAPPGLSVEEMRSLPTIRFESLPQPPSAQTSSSVNLTSVVVDVPAAAVESVEASDGVSRPVNLAATDTSCGICLDVIKRGDLLRPLPNCSHLHHQQCIDPWLVRSASCPMCRSVCRVSGEA